MFTDMGRGGAKKFLYSGPKKNTDVEDDLPWSFNSKPQKNNNSGVNGSSKLDLDNVWSIQRNVNVGGVKKQPRADQSLTYNADKAYYSRHGGGKDTDEFGSSFGGQANGGGIDPGGKSWASGNQSRRPFSYAFGTENQASQDKPVSPRNQSNSSAGLYTQSSDQSPNGSAIKAGTNSLMGNNFNSNNRGPVSMKNLSSNTNSMAGKPITSNSSSIGVSQTYNPTSRNSLFSSSNQNSSFGASNQNGIFGPSSSRGPGHGDLPAFLSPQSSRSSIDGPQSSRGPGNGDLQTFQSPQNGRAATDRSSTRQNKSFW
ncbi:uncharacterized protein DDB_G0283357-like isoform X2 [Mya arenaria]|uniref:uncharacterized protein DDB_G0283357-like isoform X2 n=1 Tax=Mya arenaria TaxID=6604 RepID=UPI0022E5AAC4|nr:uncharacterized protein DDB_G0283357-like isoform X2 [Mya arenaria]